MIVTTEGLSILSKLRNEIFVHNQGFIQKDKRGRWPLALTPPPPPLPFFIPEILEGTVVHYIKLNSMSSKIIQCDQT